MVDRWRAFACVRWSQAPPSATIPTMIRAEPAPLELPRAPAWARPGGSFRDNSEADGLFFAGAALSALDSAAKSDPPWAGVWRRRLALRSAAAVTAAVSWNT